MSGDRVHPCKILRNGMEVERGPFILYGPSMGFYVNLGEARFRCRILPAKQKHTQAMKGYCGRSTANLVTDVWGI